MKPNVLIIDDDRWFCAAVKQYLEANGFRVTTLFSGTQAVDKLFERKYALVVSDIYMSGMDGLEALRRIRHAYPSTKVLMMSGYASAELHQRMAELKADNFIPKPFKLAELLAAVKATIDPAPPESPEDSPGQES